MKRVYIAGPMSNMPESNYPAFHAAAAKLRAEGHEVVNPADNPEPPCKSWKGYMRMSVAQVASCEAICVLPGWQQSKGASLEVHIARHLELHFMEINHD